MESYEMMQARKFKEYKRRKRKEAIVEIVSAILFLGLSAFMVKLWFVAEGFSIQW